MNSLTDTQQQIINERKEQEKVDADLCILIIEQYKNTLSQKEAKVIEERIRIFRENGDLRGLPLISLKEWSINSSVRVNLEIGHSMRTTDFRLYDICFYGTYVYKSIYDSNNFFLYRNKTTNERFEKISNEIARLEHYDKHFLDVEKRDNYEH